MAWTVLESRKQRRYSPIDAGAKTSVRSRRDRKSRLDRYLSGAPAGREVGPGRTRVPVAESEGHVRAGEGLPRRHDVEHGEFDHAFRVAERHPLKRSKPKARITEI